MYRKNLKSQFPDDLSILCKTIARLVNTDLQPEAAIVNYYPMGASMGGHLDDAEHAMQKPIISISIGCSAIFLLGFIIIFIFIKYYYL
jgi:alkylated DNA repair protein alkB family protein 1